MQRKLELAALAFALTTSVGMAQQRDPNVPKNTNPPGTAGQQVVQNAQQQLDAQLANCLILSNQEEIALCRFALEHTKSDDVKKLAKQMIEDHQGFVTKLRKYASKNQDFELRTAKSNRSKEPSESGKIRQVGGTREEATTDVTTTPAGTVLPSAIGERMFAVEKQAVEECLRLSQECLKEHEGAEFDQAFLGHQIGMHIGMRAKLKAAHDNASPEFAELLKDSLTTAKEHQDHIEKAMRSESKDKRDDRKERKTDKSE